MKQIECVIFDWAGTTVDYGCMAPVAAFVESFDAIGVPVTGAHYVIDRMEELPGVIDEINRKMNA